MGWFPSTTPKKRSKLSLSVYRCQWSDQSLCSTSPLPAESWQNGGHSETMAFLIPRIELQCFTTFFVIALSLIAISVRTGQKAIAATTERSASLCALASGLKLGGKFRFMLHFYQQALIWFTFPIRLPRVGSDFLLFLQGVFWPENTSLWSERVFSSTDNSE